MDFSKPWKKGALIGGVLWVLAVILTAFIKGGMALMVVLFAPDFIILGAIIGYLYGRFFQGN